MPDGGKDLLIGGMQGLELVRTMRSNQLQNGLGRGVLAQKANVTDKLEGGARPPADSPRAKEAATQFEALLLQQMIQAMWSSVPQGGLISGSREEELYRDMLNESLARNIAEGQGIGIKEVVLNDMRRSEKK